MEVTIGGDQMFHFLFGTKSTLSVFNEKLNFCGNFGWLGVDSWIMMLSRSQRSVQGSKQRDACPSSRGVVVTLDGQPPVLHQVWTVHHMDEETEANGVEQVRSWIFFKWPLTWQILCLNFNDWVHLSKRNGATHCRSLWEMPVLFLNLWFLLGRLFLRDLTRPPKMWSLSTSLWRRKVRVPPFLSHTQKDAPWTRIK